MLKGFAGVLLGAGIAGLSAGLGAQPASVAQVVDGTAAVEAEKKPDEMESALQELTGLMLEDIVTTSQRRLTDVQTTPAAVSAYNACAAPR